MVPKFMSNAFKKRCEKRILCKNIFIIPYDTTTGTCFIYMYMFLLFTSPTKKGAYRFHVGLLSSRSKKNVLEFLKVS